MRAFCLAAIVAFTALPAWANARLTLLMDALQVSEAAEILRDEGLVYAQSLNEDMLNGQGGAFWAAQVRKIYDPQIVEEIVRSHLQDHMSEEDIDASLAYFSTPSGTRIIELENAARRAMADPEIETAARNLFQTLQEEPDLILPLVRQFVEVNGLLERNVSGAMSASYQFYKGLSDGRFMGVRRTNDDILQEVWQQEEDIRTDTEEWLYGFLLMAYQPLPLEDVRDYVAFSRTPAGRALNAALFSGFDVVYMDISYALGRAIALSSDGDEI